MKLVLLPLAISTLFLTVACAPKDSKLTRPDNRAGVNGGSNVNPQVESNKHLLLLLDRQVEALHLFKAVIDADYAQKKNLKIEDIQLNGKAVQRIFSEDIISKSGAQAQVSQVNFLVEVERAEDQSIKAVHISENKQATVEESLKLNVDAKNIDLVIRNKVKNIKIAKLDAEGQFEATVSLVDENNSISAGKFISMNDTSFVFSINGAEAKILTMSVKHVRYGNQTTDIVMDSAQSDLTVQLGDTCAAVTGNLALKSKELNNKTGAPLYTKTVGYADSSASLTAGKEKLSMPAIACESRPVVDLKKLL